MYGSIIYLRGCRCPNGGMIPMIPTDEAVKPPASFSHFVMCLMFERSSCFRSLLRYTMQIYMFEVFNIDFFSLLATCFVEKDWKGSSECPKSNMLIWLLFEKHQVLLVCLSFQSWGAERYSFVELSSSHLDVYPTARQLPLGAVEIIENSGGWFWRKPQKWYIWMTCEKGSLNQFWFIEIRN